MVASGNGSRMKVALFGGSFDPPHRGHAAVARAAAESFQLDAVLFTPTGRQPMKPHGASANYVDRMTMASLMCSQDTRFQLSGLDAPLPEHRLNYTVDTLEQLRTAYPLSTQLFAIVGADSFLELPRWHRAQCLPALAEWIVVSRPGFSLQSLEATKFLSYAGSRVHLLGGVHEDISATMLREQLARGEDCSAFLLPGVEAYIREHHLYVSAGGTSGTANKRRLS